MLRRLTALVLLVCSACATPPPPPPAPAAAPVAPVLTPPVAARKPHVTKLHGEELQDDWFWLREKGTPEVEAYLSAERAYAEGFMAPTAPLQQRLYDEMLARIQQTDTEVPWRYGGFFYYARTVEGQQYAIHARKKGTLDAPEQVLLDVNELAAGKPFLALGAFEPSHDGALLAYTTDETGFRQYTLHVRDLKTGKDGPESIPRVTGVAWYRDGRTLLYSVEDAVTKRSFQVFRHAVGAAMDDLLHEEKDERFEVDVDASRDGRFLFVTAASQTQSEVRYVPSDMPRGALALIAPRERDLEYYVTHRDGTFFIRTNDKGRNFRVVTAPVGAGRKNWKELVAHRDEVMLEHLDVFRDFYVLAEREGGVPQLRVTDFKGGATHRVTLPERAYAVAGHANREWDARVYRFTYESPVVSRSVFDYDPRTRERKLLKQQPVPGGYDPAAYTVDVTAATAPDGVRVPVVLLARKDRPRDGTGPALLTGYGSYGHPSQARFDSDLFSLVDRGFVVAVAYVRGGGELGKRWHDQGRMLNKRNTFTDFIAAAEHLIAQGYTRKERLAISGGSAGGLLMGAVVNLRPELFGAVIAHVPFVDVINTELDESLPATVTEWEEWGNPNLLDQYRYIRSYSPYDNVEAKAYPTMLVKTSYNDSQVMYWEPAKWVAKLRATKTDTRPLLLHVNMDPAGHGGRSGRYDRLRERAFDHAFLLTQLGVEEVEN